jgi:heme-degrading monooxygenase HmoA
MSRILAVHEYVLKPDADENEFEQAIRQAERQGLLALPGLVEHRFLKGLKGHRKGSYAAIWVYESRSAWEQLWGTPDHSVSKQNYPENWKAWEHEVLAAFLDRDPDAITFTAYEEF